MKTLTVEASTWSSFQDGGVEARTRRVPAVPELQSSIPFSPQKYGTCLCPHSTTSTSRST